jgi:hypothetical protein
MSKIMQKAILTLTVMLFSAGSVLAADQIRDRKRDQLKDGSCQTGAIERNDGNLLAADKTRDQKRDQLKDGSCLEG